MIVLLIIAMIIGFLLSFFIFGVALALIFLFIWIDKSIIGYAEIFHKMGIELTTITTVFLGILFDPLFAVVFAMVVIVIAHGFRYIAFPSAPSEWPPFVPHPYNFIDAIGVVVASLAGMPLFYTLIVVLAVKTMLYMIIDRIALGRPPNIIGAMMNIVFNLIIFLPVAHFFIAVSGAQLVI